MTVIALFSPLPIFAIPAGGSINYEAVNLTKTNQTLTITVDDGTDSRGVGVDSNSRLLQRREALIDNDGNCPHDYGSYYTVTYTGTYPNITTTDFSVASCYQYRWLVSDTAGNQASYDSETVVTTRPQTISIADLPLGSAIQVNGLTYIKVDDQSLFMAFQSYPYTTATTTFNYGSALTAQEYVVPQNGYYQIELWGAQGGAYSGYVGGNGAYTKGEVYLTQGERLFFYVGGQGAIFNGGGTAGDRGAIGGGATDVRLTNGDWNNTTSLNSRIIVAAGGGGGSNYSENCGIGGAGGVFTGLIATSMCSDTKDESRYGAGGSQTGGGSSGGGFGSGGAGTGRGSGGGGGYYGGGGSRNTSWGGPGGGGSSYISGYPGCIAITSETSRTAKCSTGTTEACASHYSGKVFRYRRVLPNNKTGNGQAKITFIGFQHPINTTPNHTYNYIGDGGQEYLVLRSGYYQIELWGAQGGAYGGYAGGKGAYTTGKIYLARGEKLYFYVGGQADNFNGGGTAGDRGAIGGGATDVRLINDYWNITTSLNSRIMVAAGGGGGSNYSDNCGIGGAGGTLDGLIATSMCADTSNENRYGLFGSQTAAGASGGGFGSGGAGTGGGSGGGGGWYGGGGARNTSWGGPGGGGSSFISGHDGCNATASPISTAAKCSFGSHPTCSIHYSGRRFYEWGMTANSRTGDGQATITFISDTQPTNGLNATYTQSDEYTVLQNGYYQIELWGAQGGNAPTGGYVGGKGAYTKGSIYLIQGEKLYFNIGRQAFPFNGGGFNGTHGIMGGGATDVRLTKDGVDNTASLNSRIMVAAGGGAGSYYNSVNCGVGGGGGTLYGLNPTSLCTDTKDENRYGIGAKQTVGGANNGTFSQGGTGTGDGSGGGGGYYGGGGSRATACGGPGAGGSSFISGYDGCVAITSESSRTPKCSQGTHISCATHYSGRTFTDYIMTANTRTGDGQAIITYLSETQPTNSINQTYENSGEYTVLQSGTYQIELWGAQGGNASTGGYVGGKGAYTKGKIYLTQGEKLYFYLGNQGNPFNGGGLNTIGALYGEDKSGSFGGGATDVRLVKDELDATTSLNSRIMVAAGGGGGSYYNSTNCGIGGVGGALTGLAATSQCSDTSDEKRSGTGGSQTAGGSNGASFGQGGTGIGNGSGGGGGYYGGGGARNTSWGGPGAGGSSFVSGLTGCIAITSATSRTAKCSTGDSVTCATHYSGKVFTEGAMIAGNASMPTHDNSSTMIGNTGDGYAKITLMP